MQMRQSIQNQKYKSKGENHLKSIESNESHESPPAKPASALSSHVSGKSHYILLPNTEKFISW